MSKWLLLAVLFPLHSFADDSLPKKTRFIDKLYEVVKKFSQIDTAYIEPQKYNYAVMLQNTNTYEMYRIANDRRQSVDLAPKWGWRVGPYFGWRWIFLGYTLDVAHLSSSSKRREFELSLYSNQIGIDLFYRTTGNDYYIRRLTLDDDKSLDTSPMRNVPFSGIDANIKGFNLYYITNHKKFSYPAAYSQSTRQLRSAGSPLLGIGYMHHSLSVDWHEMRRLIAERMGANVNAYLQRNDSVGWDLTRVKYDNYSISGGYAYNWVFAKNFLADISVTAGLAYLHTYSETEQPRTSFFNNFSLNRFTIDGIVRLGVVYNDSKWFAGTSAVFHAYNYRDKNFSTNSIFGNINVYVGFNFGKKK